jgi:hypothetical protein
MLACQIFKRFPNMSFWRAMRLPFKLNSLKWFLSQEPAAGVEYISQYIREFEMPAPEAKNIKVVPERIGEDYQITRKLTRKDYLK